MAKESYIERLQREKQDLVAYVKAVRAWEAAMEHASVTGRKGSAYQEVERLLHIKKELYHTIEPIMAD